MTGLSDAFNAFDLTFRFFFVARLLFELDIYIDDNTFNLCFQIPRMPQKKLFFSKSPFKVRLLLTHSLHRDDHTLKHAHPPLPKPHHFNSLELTDLPKPLSEELSQSVGSEMMTESRELTIGYEQMSMGTYYYHG
jgi:hypothetical protein